MTVLLRLDVPDAQAWRRWLARHHASSPGVWLVFRKGTTREAALRYQDALDEALCYGWIDSIVKRESDETYLRKFTPRTDPRNWSEANRRHARRLIREGRMTPAGRHVIGVPLQGGRNARNPQPPKARNASEQVPAFVTSALASRPRAAAFFSSLAPGYRRRYLGWILAAKQETTRERRLAELLELLERGVKSLLK